jgi:hypothetical protein
VIRGNFESVIPVYMVLEQLSADMRTYKTMTADIESNRFSIELNLKTNRSALEKLKSMKTKVPDKLERDIILQFDIGGGSEYLPLRYQVQALESQIIGIEENIVTNTEKYNHYKNLLALNAKLSAELKNNIPSYYTIQQFHSFLTELRGSYKAAELRDYLSSYIKRVENRISASAPITENPTISPVAKGTAKKSGIVFAVALMISVFAVFLLEGLKQNELRNEK